MSDPSCISAKLSSVLAEKFQPEVIAAKIEELMNAEVVTKGGNVRPDTRTREAAVKLCLDYTVGRPTKRVQTVTVNVDTSTEDAQELLANSPALRAELLDMIHKQDPMAPLG